MSKHKANTTELHQKVRKTCKHCKHNKLFLGLTCSVNLILSYISNNIYGKLNLLSHLVCLNTLSPHATLKTLCENIMHHVPLVMAPV